MWKYILFLITFLALCNCCKKDNPPAGNNNNNNPPKGCEYKTLPYLPSDFVAYFGSYKVGSWWVYTDIAGDRDSSYVTNYGRSGGGRQLECDSNLVTNVYIDHILVVIKSTLFDQLECQLNCTGKDSAQDFILIGQSQGIYTIYDYNGMYSGDGQQITPATLIDTMTINSVIYKNVLKFNNLEPGQPVYFAPNIGIIKKGYNGVLNLVKYHIVQ